MHKKGFTLIEVLLVVIIVGVLAAIVIPRILYTKKQAQQEACKANISAINSQLELYNLMEGGWPSPDSAIFGVASYFPDNSPACPFGSAYAIDAAKHRVTIHSHP